MERQKDRETERWRGKKTERQRDGDAEIKFEKEMKNRTISKSAKNKIYASYHLLEQ